MSGVTSAQERVAQDEAVYQEAAQIKQRSAGQAYETGALVSSQSQAQAAGSNAPIEIRKKQEGGEEGEDGNDRGDQADKAKKDEMADEVKNQREMLKKVAMRIFHQIKSGCKKDLCLNVHCRRNAFGKWQMFNRLSDGKNQFKFNIQIYILINLLVQPSRASRNSRTTRRSSRKQ
jgi:hypothetical protein